VAAFFYSDACKRFKRVFLKIIRRRKKKKKRTKAGENESKQALQQSVVALFSFYFQRNYSDGGHEPSVDLAPNFLSASTKIFFCAQWIGIYVTKTPKLSIS
jgi:hypothetical protein